MERKACGKLVEGETWDGGEARDLRIGSLGESSLAFDDEC